jgi:hypothetical protein
MRELSGLTCFGKSFDSSSRPFRWPGVSNQKPTKKDKDMKNVTAVQLKSGEGRIYPVLNHFGFTHPNGSQGEAATWNEAEASLYEIENWPKKEGLLAKIGDIPLCEIDSKSLEWMDLDRLASAEGYNTFRSFANEGNLWGVKLS